MKLALIPDWKNVSKNAWSVRLITLSAIFSLFEVYVPQIAPLIVWLGYDAPAGVFSAIAALFALLAGIARVIAQPGMAPTETDA
jgi:hypothetical protein